MFAGLAKPCGGTAHTFNWLRLFEGFCVEKLNNYMLDAVFHFQYVLLFSV